MTVLSTTPRSWLPSVLWGRLTLVAVVLWLSAPPPKVPSNSRLRLRSLSKRLQIYSCRHELPLMVSRTPCPPFSTRVASSAGLRWLFF